MSLKMSLKCSTNRFFIINQATPIHHTYDMLVSTQ